MILICAHMAQNPHFSLSWEMCLKGDIKVGAYFLSSDDAHVSVYVIGILSCTFFETLDLHYKKIITFARFLDYR